MTEQRRYDVALSFAGEDREYVEQVANSLQASGVKVFYDNYERVELWGKDLYEHLDFVYRKSSRYCVMFVSNAYATKVWTTHERKSAQARALTENQEYVLPARFDDTEIPGLAPTIGHIDLQSLEPAELSQLIKEKLGPRNLTPGFPPKVDRLYAALGLKAAKSKDKTARREARDVALSLYEAMGRMSLEERTAFAGVLAFGCCFELPEGVHISLDLLSRMTTMPHAEIVDALSAVRSLGVTVRLRDPSDVHPPAPGELTRNDKDILLTFYAPRAPLSKQATTIAYTAVQQATSHFCADHGLKVVTALDFHRLSSEDSGPILMPDEAHADASGSSSC